MPSCERDFIAVEGEAKGIAEGATHIYWSTNGEVPINPGNDLYRYDAGSGQLSDLTVDEADPDGAEVQGAVGAPGTARRFTLWQRRPRRGKGRRAKGTAKGRWAGN